MPWRQRRRQRWWSEEWVSSSSDEIWPYGPEWTDPLLTHLPYEDPDQPETAGEEHHEAVPDEVETAVALLARLITIACHYVSFRVVEKDMRGSCHF